MNPVLALVVAICLAGIGRWGRLHAVELAPAWMDPDGRESRIRSLRRGSTVCLALGGVFVVASVVSAFP